MTLRQWRLLWPACLLAAALCPAFPRAQSPSDCVVAGTIASGATPLPGVVVTLAGADGQTVDITSTAPDGSYALRIRSAQAERLTLKAELVAFAPVTREIGASCQQRVDLAMTLASRGTRARRTGARAAAVPKPRARCRSSRARAAGRRRRRRQRREQLRRRDAAAAAARFLDRDVGGNRDGRRDVVAGERILFRPERSGRLRGTVWCWKPWKQ